MAELSQYQNVFRLAKNGSSSTSQSRAPRVKKRSRQPVSCTACRARKLKCNRHLPCMACSKKGDAASCYYSKSSTDACESSSNTSEAQLRLEKLEQMVTNLMQTSNNIPTDHVNHDPPGNVNVGQSMNGLSLQSSAKPPQISSVGHLDTYGSETKYLGATHWATILENIHDIQGYLEPETDEEIEELSANLTPNGPDIALDTKQSLSLADVLNCLPSWSITDRILASYFNGSHFHNPIIHRLKFLREYESFRTNPSSPNVSFLWISMLFSTLWLGYQMEKSHCEKTPDFTDNRKASSFIVTAGQALIVGGYRKARPYSVEAALLYGHCKYLVKEDPDADAWMIMGICARLALRMGYHRDPRHLKNISPFQGEMRRRTFQVIQIFDLLMSFQAGIPAVIREEECDTEPPSNLFDEDFDEDCVVLPTSRPSTDITRMLYYTYKSRFAKVFGRVIRHALALKKPPYEETMSLDAELQAAREDVPQSLKMTSLRSSFIEPSHMILNRLNIELLYLKSICVLHRNYLIQERSNPAFAYSRKICLDAALQIVQYQADIYATSQVGGRFFEDRWVLSSLTLHDFLLAAMITCLDLYEAHKSPSAGPIDLEGQIKKWDALQLSQEIWISRRAVSQDARRASNILAIMFSKIPKPNVTGTSMIATQPFSIFSQPSTNGSNSGGLSRNGPSSSSHNSISFEDSDDGFYARSYAASNINASDRLNTMLDESENIDWGMLDQYLLDRGGVDDDVSLDWDLLDS